MSVLKDKNRGTWAYHGYYRDVTGVRHQYHQRGFATKREAKEAETGFLLAARKKRPGITLNELVLLYRENFPALGIKESTLISNESYYKNHIQEYLGAACIDTLTAPSISHWLSLLAKQKQESGQPFSVATVNKSRDVLSKYLSYAVRLGYLEYNPCRSIPCFKRPETVPDRNPNFWEVSTFNYFISRVDDPYWRDVFTFLFDTGVREGELFALRWSDIDLGSARCRITKTLTNKTREHGWKITAPKTRNSIRTVDLQDSLVSMLRARYAQESRKDGFSSDYFVFGDIAPLSRQRLANYLDMYIKATGVPRITPHGFRHSHASCLIRCGKIDDQLIADRLGHTVEEMRKTYAHIYEDSRSNLRSVLNEIF